MTNNGILKNAEYFRLVTAAELLGCSAHELLHLGAIGKAEIMAPVLLNGTYEWPVGWDGMAYPEMEPSFRSDFDIRDRVVLLIDDLKKIEAVGGATPRTFFAPSKGLEIAKYWRGGSFFDSVPSLEEGTTEDQIITSKTYYPELAIEMQTQPEPAESKSPDFFARMQENAISVPWYLGRSFRGRGKSDQDEGEFLDGPQNAEFSKTTAEHLFISKAELNRLAENAPQDSAVLKRQQADAKRKKVHGNAERYSSKREQVLSFAIYCKDKWPEPCAGSVTNWAKVIDEKALLGWESGEPPLSRVEIEKLLRQALVIGDKTR